MNRPIALRRAVQNLLLGCSIIPLFRIEVDEPVAAPTCEMYTSRMVVAPSWWVESLEFNHTTQGVLPVVPTSEVTYFFSKYLTLIFLVDNYNFKLIRFKAK